MFSNFSQISKFHVGFYMVEQMAECLNKGQRKAAISSTQTHVLPLSLPFERFNSTKSSYAALSAVHLSNCSFTHNSNYSIYTMIMIIIIKESGLFTKINRKLISRPTCCHMKSLCLFIFKKTVLPNYPICFYRRPNAFLARSHAHKRILRNCGGDQHFGLIRKVIII